MNVPVHRMSAIALVTAGAIVSVGCRFDTASTPAVHGCNGSCAIPYVPATLNLSCSTTDLVSVAVSGPCSTDGAPWYRATGQFIEVTSPSAGICHVELTFATGFAYSTDVTFTTPPADPSVCCPVATAPTQATFTVNNPSATCVDTSSDAGDVEAATDFPTDAYSAALTSE